MNIALHAQTLDFELDLNFSKDEWNVGVAEFRDLGVTPDQSHLLKLIPTMLYERILPCDSHLLTNKEIEILAIEFYKDKILSLQKSLSTQQKEYDEMFFERDVTDETRKAKSISIRELYFELERYKQIQTRLELIEIEKEFPCNIIDNGEENPLYPVVEINIQDFMKDKKIDMLLTGTVEQIEGLIFYTIELFSAGIDEPVLSLRRGGDYQTVQDLMLQIRIKSLKWS